MMTTAESTVFPSGVFAPEVEFSRASIDAEQSELRHGTVQWRKQIIAAAVSPFSDVVNVVRTFTSRAIVLVRAGRRPLSDEDLEDLVDAGETRRRYRTTKIQGLTRYREYREHREKRAADKT
jgi:hypothetical protein